MCEVKEPCLSRIYSWKAPTSDELKEGFQDFKALSTRLTAICRDTSGTPTLPLPWALEVVLKRGRMDRSTQDGTAHSPSTPLSNIPINALYEAAPALSVTPY
jgi:hypothetical protein